MDFTMKNYIASALTGITLSFASTVQSIELYNDEKTSFDFKGNLSVYYLENGDVSEINDGFSRYVFDLKHELKNDWKALALLEWGVQISKTESSIVIDNNGLTSTGASTDTTWLRLGYVGFTHEKYGRFTVGKQWGLSYDVAGVTDYFEIFGAGAQGTYNFGTDGGFSGSGRAEQAIQYKVNYDDFTFGAQYLVSDDVIFTEPGDDEDKLVSSAGVQFDNAYAMSVIYQAPYDISLGLAYNKAHVNLISGDIQSETLDDELITAHLTYGVYDSQGLHVALVLTDMKYHETNDVNQVMYDSTGIELYSVYRIEDISYILGYISLKDNSNYEDSILERDNSYHKNYYILSAKYHWSDNFYLFMEGKIDNSQYIEENSQLEENALGLGMMFVF